MRVKIHWKLEFPSKFLTLTEKLQPDGKTTRAWVLFDNFRRWSTSANFEGFPALSPPLLSPVSWDFLNSGRLPEFSIFLVKERNL